MTFPLSIAGKIHLPVPGDLSKASLQLSAAIDTWLAFNGAENIQRSLDDVTFLWVSRVRVGNIFMNPGFMRINSGRISTVRAPNSILLVYDFDCRQTTALLSMVFFPFCVLFALFTMGLGARYLSLVAGTLPWFWMVGFTYWVAKVSLRLGLKHIADVAVRAPT
jgi:hypothetical protein